MLCTKRYLCLYIDYSVLDVFNKSVLIKDDKKDQMLDNNLLFAIEKCKFSPASIFLSVIYL